MSLDFVDKHSLAEAYEHFSANPDFKYLHVKATENFEKACAVFTSLFTRIEAAGGIVRNKEAEYLFIKRFGVWDLPKGKLHKKEPVQHGAIREVTEETGLTGITISKQLPSTYHIFTDRKGREVLKETFWFEMICTGSQNLVPQLEEDITEVKWFSEKDLYIPLRNTYASLRKLLENYLQQ